MFARRTARSTHRLRPWSRPLARGTLLRATIAGLGRVSACLLLFCLASAAAQDLGVAIGASSEPAVELTLRDVPRAGGIVGAAARLGVDPGGAVSFRWSEVLGGIGNLVVEGDAAARFGAAPAARATLGARGVLGPVAARIHLDAFSAPPERFAPAGRPADAPFDAGISLRLAADGRVDRTWLLAAGGTGWRGEDGWSLDVDASARGRALLGSGWDGRIAVASRWGSYGSYQSVGLGVVRAPRRAPEVSVTAWLDRAAVAGASSWRPGVELDGAWRVGPDRFELRLVARPAGRLRAPWSLESTWRRPWNDGTLELRAGARAGGASGEAWDVRVGYEMPIDLSFEPAAEARAAARSAAATR